MTKTNKFFKMHSNIANILKNMRKNLKKKGAKYNLGLAIALAALIVASIGIFLSRKPAITGFVVVTKETTHTDNVNLLVNESKNVTWDVKNPGALKLVKASGSLSRNGTAKVYLKKVDEEKQLIFDSTKTLFDVNVHVLPDYKKIFNGDEMLLQIILFNLRGFGTVNVDVKYSIKDKNGNIVATEKEAVAVETQATFVRKLLIPADLKPGTYVAFVEVQTPDGLVGTSSDSFEVMSRFEEKYPPLLKYYAIGVAVVFVAGILAIYSLYLYRKAKKKKETKELKEKMPEEKVQKLEKELKALGSAYNSKFISEQSYYKDKERIEKELKKLGRPIQIEEPKEVKQEESKKEESKD